MGPSDDEDLGTRIRTQREKRGLSRATSPTPCRSVPRPLLLEVGTRRERSDTRQNAQCVVDWLLGSHSADLDVFVHCAGLRRSDRAAQIGRTGAKRLRLLGQRPLLSDHRGRCCGLTRCPLSTLARGFSVSFWGVPWRTRYPGGRFMHAPDALKIGISQGELFRVHRHLRITPAT